jgi:hypothetical protein
LATALAVRVAAVVLLVPAGDRPITYEHGAIADNLLAGRGFTVWFLGSQGPTSQQAPWTPTLLALCSWPFGRVTPTSVVLFELLECLAGTGTVFAAARLGWNLFPERRSIGWAAGLCATFYPPHVYMATHVQAAPWAALGVTTLFALATERRIAVSFRGWALLGVPAGWLLLVDPIFLLVLPIVAWQAVRTAGVEKGTFYLNRKSGMSPFFPAVAAACAFGVVVPWLVRNVVVHGEFVFVKSTFGYAFWQGNNPLSRGTDKIPKPEVAAAAAAHDGSFAGQNQALWEARHETLYIDDVLLKPTGYAEFAGLTEPARSRLLGRRAADFIAAHPAAYATLCLRRLRYFLLWDDTNPKTLHPIYQTATAAWLALASIGLLSARRDWRTLAPTMLSFFVVLAFHTLTITSARFRIPLEPLTFAWIGAGFAPHIVRLAQRALSAMFKPHEASDDDERVRQAPTTRGPLLRGPHTPQNKKSPSPLAPVRRGEGRG